jgi:NADP-dependent 3-hydroxy acid dehydrogenase YdfG
MNTVLYYNLLHFNIRYELDKVAMMTGSSPGIGEAIALEYAMAGYNIIINSRNQEELSISTGNNESSIWKIYLTSSRWT